MLVQRYVANLAKNLEVGNLATIGGFANTISRTTHCTHNRKPVVDNPG